MMNLERVLYTAEVTASGGREGRVQSADGLLEMSLAVPQAMGGPGQANNPEQLFAAGYSACFLGALKHAAKQAQLTIDPKAWVKAAVSIGPIPGGFGLQTQLSVHVPNLEPQVLQDLIEKTHTICPYSNATRGNMQVVSLIV